jgi:F-type H+-transporting ATPase subunit b
MLDLNLSTILLQMANFFILVFILYRFLFKPLQNIMKKRSIETMKAMDDAKDAEKAAVEKQRLFEEKTNNIDAEISARRNEARIVIERTRQQMLNEVQGQVEKLKNQTEETLSQMQMRAVQQHKEKLGELATTFVSGIISDVMSPELEHAYRKEFINQIRQVDLEKFTEDLAPGDIPDVKVLTAKLLDDEDEKQIESILRQGIPQKINLSFDVDSDLIAGGLIRFENELIDGSIQAQIETFKKKYQAKA